MTNRPRARDSRTEATPFALLTRHLQRRVQGRRCRALLITGNPFGNAIGDTVMTAEHVGYLRQVGDGAEITVWSATSETWRFLDPAVRTIALVTPQQWSHGFDLIVAEGRPLDRALSARATRHGAAVLEWAAGNRHASLTLGRRPTMRVPLPPATNMPRQIALVYEALGFGAREPLLLRRPPPAPTVFFNPFASNAQRSLSPAFTEMLLDAVLPILAPGQACVAQAHQTPVRHDDVERYEELSACLSSPRFRKRLSRRAMDLGEYLRQVTGSRLVIGADTSSQHLAAAAGRPSIAFYPPNVSQGFYLVWGPTCPTCFHFTAPPDRDAHAQRALAKLVAAMVARLVGQASPGPGLRRVRAAHAAATALMDCARRFVEGEADAGASLEARLRQLEDLLRGAVLAPVLRELQLLWLELRSLGPQPSVERRVAVIRQLEYLNSMKVLRLLAAPSPTARPAAPPSSAGRGARSRARASR